MKANILRNYRTKYKIIEYNGTYWLAKRNLFGYYILIDYLSTDNNYAQKAYRDFILEKLAKRYYKWKIV